MSLAGYSAYKKDGREGANLSSPFSFTLLKHKSFSPIPKTPKTIENRAYISSNFLYHDRAMWVYFYNDKKELKFDRELNFEMITEEKVLKFKLRNANDKTTTLKEINLAGSGISLVGTKVGDEYKKWQWREVTIIASSVGDIEANSILTLVFDNQVIAINIVGTRAVVFSYKPKYSYSEMKSFKTDIFRANSGKETRVSLSDKPRLSSKLSITTKELENGVAELLSFALGMYCLVPLWYSLSLSQSTGNLNVLNCDTENRDFSDYLIVWRNFKDFSFAKILNKTKNSITIDKQISINRGDYIIPLYKATPSKSINYSFLTSEVESYEIEFRELL